MPWPTRFWRKNTGKGAAGLDSARVAWYDATKGGGGLVSVWAAPTHRFYRPTPTKRVFCCVEGSSRILGRLFVVAGTAIYLLRARTQQNKNFVALDGVMCYNRGRNGCGQKNEALMCNACLEAAAVRPSSKSVSSAVSAARYRRRIVLDVFISLNRPRPNDALTINVGVCKAHGILDSIF